MNFEIFASEKEGADWILSKEKCIEAMKNADMVILVMGKSYGHIPTICEFPFDGNTSVTHAEYKIAVKYNKPILIYVKDVEEREERQADFINSVRNFNDGYFTAKYQDVPQLEERLRSDMPSMIARLLQNRYRYHRQSEPQVIKFNRELDVYRYVADCIIWVLKNIPSPSLMLCGGRTSSPSQKF